MASLLGLPLAGLAVKIGIEPSPGVRVIRYDVFIEETLQALAKDMAKRGVFADVVRID